MADKVSAGQPIPRSAALWNNLIGAANQYASEQLGEPRGSYSPSIPTDVIKIKNSSGAQIRCGEILEISGYLLTNVLRTSIWFDGAIPNTTRPFGIALQDIPHRTDGVIDRAQVSGVTVALINVTNTAHGYATPASGNVVLQSAYSGPIRILYKPSGTGEKMCAVVFTTEPGLHWIEFALTAALTTGTASTTADVVSGFGFGTPAVDAEVTVLNLLTHTAGVYMFAGSIGWKGLAMHKGGTVYQIFQLECPPA